VPGSGGGSAFPSMARPRASPAVRTGDWRGRLRLTTHFQSFPKPERLVTSSPDTDFGLGRAQKAVHPGLFLRYPRSKRNGTASKTGIAGGKRSNTNQHRFLQGNRTPPLQSTRLARSLQLRHHPAWLLTPCNLLFNYFEATSSYFLRIIRYKFPFFYAVMA